MRELRLHFDNNTITCHERGLSHDMAKGVCVDCGWKQASDITAALIDWELINASKKEWAELDMVQFETLRQVRLHIGTIHDDGFFECAYVTRYYFEDKDGQVRYTSSGHA